MAYQRVDLGQLIPGQSGMVYYDADSGRVDLDGMNITTLDALRQQQASADSQNASIQRAQQGFTPFDLSGETQGNRGKTWDNSPDGQGFLANVNGQWLPVMQGPAGTGTYSGNAPDGVSPVANHNFNSQVGSDIGDLIPYAALAITGANMAGVFPDLSTFGSGVGNTVTGSTFPPGSFNIADAGGVRDVSSGLFEPSNAANGWKYSASDVSNFGNVAGGGLSTVTPQSGSLSLGSFLNSPMSLLAGANLAGAGIGALSSLSAAKTQAEGAQNAAGINQGMFNTLNDQNAPYRQAGVNALNTISSLSPQFLHQFDANDLKTNLAPNYQFMLDQGLGAAKNFGNLQTGLVSGNTAKGVVDYATNYAGTGYQQAFNNYNAQQTNIFNRLSNIAGLGQTANQTTATAGAPIGQAIGNAAQGVAAANASGTVGATNALTGGVNNAASWYSLPSIMQMGRG